MPDKPSAIQRAAGSIPAAIPSVDRILNMGFARALIEKHGRAPVLRALRSTLAALRDQATQGNEPPPDAFSEPSFAARLQAVLATAARPRLIPVFNLTGTILHTNLGRALLPESAVRAVMTSMSRACNLEYDLRDGARGDRDTLVESLLCELTGAEAATVVNNNAAGIFLALNTLALRKEVIVSRGELVEIGGSFRIPDILARSGCRLKEVGTTNRTHLKDFEDAIHPRTGMLLKVHASNYAIQGFTAAVSEQALADLAHARSLPMMVDLGSGALVDLTQWGLPKEPMPQESLANGADLVTFSGDKLLGGPQSGIILGRSDLMGKIRKNPLKRALRVDKMGYAALEAVLRLYRDPDRLAQTLPTLRLLTRSLTEIKTTTVKLLPLLERALAGKAGVSLKPCRSQIGSGSLPVNLLPSVGIAITPSVKGKGKGSALKGIEQAFRNLPIPVIGHIADDAFCLDIRCLEESDVAEFVGQLDQLAY